MAVSPTFPLKPPFSKSLTGGDVPQSSTSAAIEARLHALMPPLYHDRRYQLQRPSADPGGFLHHDLSVKRLNDIHGWLALAGRPQPARPLHRQLMMDRRIIVTEQVDLHLTWSESRIYIKPLPNYLLNLAFWEHHICKDAALYANAYGLLLSYLWLITYESDFQIAMDNSKGSRLLPPHLTWDMWKAFLEDFLTGVDLTSRKLVDRRYKYGELRLGHLNMIYRFSPRYLFRFAFVVRGYHSGYHQYSVFFKRNFTWLIVVFAYTSVVLTAMQLGVATDQLGKDQRFQNASYGFAVFSIIVPVIALGIAILLFLWLCIDNALATLNARQRPRSTVKEGRGTTGKSKGEVV